MRPISKVEPLVFPGNMFQSSDNMGLTKRELFALIVLAGMFAGNGELSGLNFHTTALEAITVADALIAGLAESDREDA